MEEYKNIGNKNSYVIGLDIGIASVGWCALAENQILGMGVRAFDSTENPQKGTPLGQVWRKIRCQRRTIRRKASRLRSLLGVFRSEGVSQGSIESFRNSTIPRNPGKSPWELRFCGLDRLLSESEWVRVLYHIVKNRGPKLSRKEADTSVSPVRAKEEDRDDDKKKILSGIKDMRKEFAEKGYRSPGEMAVLSPSFAESKRNKGGQYKHVFPREMLESELTTLFRHQRSFGNPLTAQSFEAKVLECFSRQKAPIDGEAMMEMIGHCTFEKSEKRAPKASHSAEMFVLMEKINHFSIFDGSEARPLTQFERDQVKRICLSDSRDGRTTLADVRKVLVEKCELKNDRLQFISGKFGFSKKKKSREDKDVLFASMPGRTAFRKALLKKGMDQYWSTLSSNPDLMDEIVGILAIEKEEPVAERRLLEMGLPSSVVEAILLVPVKDFLHLSIKAIRKILPFMEKDGDIYSDACKKAGYEHYRPEKFERTKFLPPIPKDEIRNPVVLKSLGQSRKVLNAIIREFGSPDFVRVEMAREMAKTFKEREEEEKGNKDRQQANDKLRAEFRETLGRDYRGDEFTRYRLYKEQDGKCLYSGEAFDGLNRVICEQGYAEIDHILPISRSFDDSLSNRVLVMASENQKKGNLDLWEYLNSKGEAFCEKFSIQVSSNKKLSKKKISNLLNKTPDYEKMSARNLVDTGWIAKFFRFFVDSRLAFASENGSCTATNGKITSMLRGRWGFEKNREEGDLHHAVDAAVIAVCGPGMVQKVSEFHKWRRSRFSSGHRDEKIPFPKPWETFREDVLKARENIFVSRPPKRLGTGSAHLDTIFSKRETPDGDRLVVKASLPELNLKDLENLVGKNDPRNKVLYDEIRRRLEKKEDKKAFVEPLLRNVTSGPVVKSVKLYVSTVSGVHVRGGVARNEAMLRTDIFTKNGKFYAVPIYVNDIVEFKKSGRLPNKAIVSHKPESNWIEMSEDYLFLFSLYPDDLVKTVRAQKCLFGYFGGTDRDRNSINIKKHDKSDKAVDPCIKTLFSIEKYHVTVLGKVYRTGPEKRIGLDVLA